ncbi:hypothetical protein SDC9_79061 [bioreactor metagenome]|uniref:Uncharacterized protein n=1 Tax=bioreactor metagenome TaxID=1076179 RepID=A0A644YWV1_9ZZZZ
MRWFVFGFNGAFLKEIFRRRKFYGRIISHLIQLMDHLYVCPGGTSSVISYAGNLQDPVPFGVKFGEFIFQFQVNVAVIGVVCVAKDFR